MIYLTGKNAPSFREQRAARPPDAPEPFGGSAVFVSDAGTARTLAVAGSAAVAAAIGGGRAFVWMDGERVAAALRFDASLLVSEDFVLDAGPLRLRIGRGARVRDPGGGPAIVEGGGAITLAARGGRPARVARVALREGRLELAAPASPSLDVSMRYFYGAGAALAGIRYPLIAGVAAGGTVSLDPLRPGGPSSAPAGFAFVSTFTTPLGGVVMLDPAGGSLVQEWDPVAGEFYWTPDGPWRLGFGGLTGGEPAGGPQTGQVMLGLQGLEYAAVLSGSPLRFSQGPAYAPWFGASGPAGTGLTSTFPGSSAPLRTAWVYFDAGRATGPSGLGYYAQPQGGALFRPPAADAPSPGGGPTGLQSFPLRAGGFPAGASGATAAFPAVPYAAAAPAGGGGATAGWLSTLQSFEQVVLAPARRVILQALNAAGPTGVPASGPGSFGCTAMDGPTFSIPPWSPTGPPGGGWAVTQQGMVSTFSGDYAAWNSIVLAQDAGGGPGLLLTGIGERMRTAMLANDLFLVVSDAKLFEQACSTTYVLTAEALAGVTGMPQAAVEGAALLLDTVYYGVDYFQCALRSALGAAAYAAYGEALTTLAQAARLTISGWTFDLSPRRWNADTILVIKLCSRDLVDAAADTAFWTMPEEFNASPAATRARLMEILGEPFGLGGFRSVLRNWNGILYLSCNVDTAGLPPQLAGLAAGIPGPTFTAHHLGINLSPVVAGGAGPPQLAPSSLFAAIDYASPGDLQYAGRPYAFKVARLQLGFQNSQVVSFGSTLQLLVGELFGEPATLAGSQGGILLLQGTWQKHGENDTYAFTFQGETRFRMSSAVLRSVTVSSAQFVTLQGTAGAGGATVASQFLLNGTLAFRALPVDVFSFGPAKGARGAAGLAFTNLQVSMQFPGAEPGRVAFAFSAGQAGVSAPPGAARPGSLYAGLPLTVTSLLQGTADALPPTLGYAPVITPLDPGKLGAPWFGVALSLNLGSAGALAAAGGLAAQLLLAWAPDSRGYNVAVWIRLPGAGSSGATIPLEGPLTLNVQNVSLIAGAAGDYLLQLGDITLGIFGLQLPFWASTSMLLFGNPDPQDAAASLGWYAAYQQNET